jgi:hypothetical protein
MPALRFWPTAAALILIATVAQLAVGAFAGLDQFAGKAFGARLAFYPAMMLFLPALWAILRRARPHAGPIPWDATALVMWGFFVDVTGNTLDLYDTIKWWDDANHYCNWLTLTLGVGICLARFAPSPRWLLALAVTGIGCVLALLWEAGEWYTFIRHGTELSTAYEDTLGDMLLGTAGSLTAALILVWMLGRRARRRDREDAGYVETPAGG